MTLEDFIKKYIRLAPEGKHIELTPAQRSFVYWMENCKKNGIKPSLKGRV